MPILSQGSVVSPSNDPPRRGGRGPDLSYLKHKDDHLKFGDTIPADTHTPTHREAARKRCVEEAAPPEMAVTVGFEESFRGSLTNE